MWPITAFPLAIWLSFETEIVVFGCCAGMRVFTYKNSGKLNDPTPFFESAALDVVEHIGVIPARVRHIQYTVLVAGIRAMNYASIRA